LRKDVKGKRPAGKPVVAKMKRGNCTKMPWENWCEVSCSDPNGKLNLRGYCQSFNTLPSFGDETANFERSHQCAGDFLVERCELLLSAIMKETGNLQDF
jgi:hypothetical protein